MLGLDYYPKLQACVPFSPVTGAPGMGTAWFEKAYVSQKMIVCCSNWVRQSRIRAAGLL